MLDCHKAQEDKTLRIKDTSGLHLNRVRPSHSFTPPPAEQNQLLQDQIQCTIPTPDCNTFLLKQGELR